MEEQNEAQEQKYWLKLNQEEVLTIGRARHRDPKARKWMTFTIVGAIVIGLGLLSTESIPWEYRQYLVIVPFLIIFIVWGIKINKLEKAAKLFLEEIKEKRKH